MAPVELLANRYRLGELLGRGGMAEVYRADDQLLGRAVAVKVFGRHAEIPEEEIRQRSEVQLLASLAHPGLVTVFDAGTDTSDADSPRSYLVLQLVEGSTLGERLSLGALPREDVHEIGCQLAAALAYVHGRGIVHRDVKPANILLSTADATVVAKLADFGIARIIDSAPITTAGTTVGTANYLSPEQVRGDAVGQASDIYSLGLVLLECLTGVRTYPGVGVEAAVVRLHRPPAIPGRLGPAWVGLLSAMTADEPAQRPSAPEALHQLRGLTKAQISATAGAIRSVASAAAAGAVGDGGMLGGDSGCDVPTEQLGPFAGRLWSDAPRSDAHRPLHRRRPLRASLVALGGVLCGAAVVFFGYLTLSDPGSQDSAATPRDPTNSANAHAPAAATARRAEVPAGAGNTPTRVTARPVRAAQLAEVRAVVKPVPKAVKPVSKKVAKRPKKQRRGGGNGDEGD